MNKEYQPRSFTLRRPGGRLELWLLGIASMLILVPGAVLFLLVGLRALTSNAFVDSMVSALALGWLLCWAMAGGLMFAAIFVFVRRKLAG